jgi:secreted PhoX family phosphatase
MGLSFGAGFAGLGCVRTRIAPSADPSPLRTGYGGLISDPDGIVDLPAGFSYQVISRTGDMMDDGLFVPAAHDGMATFEGPDGRTLIVRNHELSSNDRTGGPFGPTRSLEERIDASMIYDDGAFGGTTTLIYDTRQQRLERHYLSLVGTVRNCAGGPTPWNSWISSEEPQQLVGNAERLNHGFNFEVPAGSQTLVRPVPLRAMGRFNHEAVAVDRPSGVVYETEDRADGLFYRFIPDVAGELAAGGRLQALKIVGLDGADTSNNDTPVIDTGRVLQVEWVDLDDVESPQDDLRIQGLEKGAARFSRGEGIWSGPGEVYFAATSGGRSRTGQVFRYRPSPFEGTREESSEPGTLELFVEPNDTELIDQVDNIALTPWGDLILCEDGRFGNYVRCLTPSGELYPIIRNAMNNSEFAGSVFSPDGSTLFVNIQRPGLTLAVTGPWG